MKPFKTEQQAFRALLPYLHRIRYVIIALVSYTVLIHFRLFNTLVPGIDTEHLINSPETLYDSWMGIGRQGLWLTKYLTGNTSFNPDFAVILTLLLLAASCLLVPFLASLAAGNTEGYKGEAWLTLLFGMLVVSHPILTEQLYFTLQSAEVVLSFLLLELCLLGAHFWGITKNPLWLVLTVLFLQLPFSTYQAFVPLFIAGAVGMSFLRGLFSGESIRRQWAYIVKLIIAFLGGFLLNQIISRLFFSGASYLGNQFHWSEAGIWGGLLNILSHIWETCVGWGTFYFMEFGLLCLALLALIIRHCIQLKKPGVIVWQLFLLAAWLAAPFYLSILLGIRPVIRAQLVLPFTTGGTAFLSLYCLMKRVGAKDKDIQADSRTVPRNIALTLLVLLCAETVYHEASVTSRLYYTDGIRAQADYSLAVSLQQDIQAFTGETDYDGAVVFWGRREAASNPSCIHGDVMGQSFFNWDTDVAPLYFYSSNRIINFLGSLGISYSAPSPAQIENAAQYVKDAPCYPSPGSIFWVDDTIVVKLSEK